MFMNSMLGRFSPSAIFVQSAEEGNIGVLQALMKLGYDANTSHMVEFVVFLHLLSLVHVVSVDPGF